jgi:hypothetical protein
LLRLSSIPDCANSFVGFADHDALDLRRVDVLAAGNVHLLEAILDVEIISLSILAQGIVADNQPAKPPA